MKNRSIDHHFFEFPLSCVVVGFLLLSGLTTTTHAQYFGRNKVQYDRFNFHILKSKHFNVYFYKEEEPAVKDAARMLERWYFRWSRLFDYELPDKQPLILYANHADFQQTNVLSGFISQGTGGVTEGIARRIILPLAGVNKDDDHVLGHELVHAFQYAMADSFGRGLVSMNQLPLWAIEGMAEYFPTGREDAHTAMWLRDAVLNDDMPSIKKMTIDPRYFPYRYGEALWAFIGGKWGDDKIAPIYREALTKGLDSAFIDILGVTSDSLSKLWVAEVQEHFRSQLEGRTPPKEVGERILAEDIDAGEMNLAPSISPDGKYVAFLSEKDLFTIDLFLADAHTGKVLRKIASSNRDSHYDAISFLKSTGAWSPDNRRFAFVVIRQGDYGISIVDVDTRKITRTIQIDSIKAIYDLAWSPDGKYLAFSGSESGISDLYLMNLENGTVRQLTNDRYSDIQPAWSPDGNWIAFVSDRGTGTDLATLAFGPMRIALLNVQTGTIETLSLFPAGKQINPQFSPDGSSLYFVADPDGISNLYRYSFPTNQIYRLTNIATGVSGITAFSPCLTVSRETGRVLFSVFDHGKYNVNALEGDALTGTAVSPGEVTRYHYALLPPVALTGSNLVDQYLENPSKDILADTTFTVMNYRSSLGLKYVGQASIGVAADRFGTSLGGGVSFLFADMLNNHVLGVAAQLNGTLKDLGGQVVYQNLAGRANWGAALSHIPYRVEQAFVGYDTVSVGGVPFLAQSVIFQRQRVFNDRITLLGDYPLSTNRRFEGAIGYNRIGYSAEIETITSVGGQVIDRNVQSLPAPSSLNLMQASLAYVGDYSFFGFTSPVNGSRYRLEVEGTLGTLNFISVLADYRHYFFHNPFTLAFRFLHYGRYLGDSESNRLTPLFIGYETYVRGYEIGSFDATECTRGANPGECPEFDRLLGSRMAVFNAELRFPLLGVKRFGLINFPVLPTEFALFFDGGTAWTAKESPRLKWATRSNERIPVFSAGAALRFNIFNVLIPQIYYAFPFQRPEKTGVFGFVLALGW